MDFRNKFKVEIREEVDFFVMCEGYKDKRKIREISIVFVFKEFLV